MGENCDNPIELEDWDESDSENGTGEIKTKKSDKKINYEMLLDTEDEVSENNDKMDEVSEVSIEATDKSMLYSGSDGEVSNKDNDMEDALTTNNMDTDQAANEISPDSEKWRKARKNLKLTKIKWKLNSSTAPHQRGTSKTPILLQIEKKLPA